MADERYGNDFRPMIRDGTIWLSRQGCGFWLAVAAVAGITWFVFSQPAMSDRDPPTDSAPVAALAEDTRAQCRQLLADGERQGLIRERPIPGRINVDEVLWAGLPAASKEGIMLAVSCDDFGVAAPATFDQRVVVYGWRSGRRLWMLTMVGFDRGE